MVRAISDLLEHLGTGTSILLSPCYFKNNFWTMNFQLASIVQWSTALSYVRDVPRSNPGYDTYFYNVGFIVFQSSFFSKFFFIKIFPFYNVFLVI